MQKSGPEVPSLFSRTNVYNHLGRLWKAYRRHWRMFVSVLRIVVKLKLIWQPYGLLIQAKAAVLLLLLCLSISLIFSHFYFLFFPVFFFFFWHFFTLVYFLIQLFPHVEYSQHVFSDFMKPLIVSAVSSHTCRLLVCADGWVLVGLSCVYHV